MIIMAIDHVVYFVGRFHPAEYWNTAPPVFPNGAFEALRFLTHVCAPGFVLFAGMGLSLSYAKSLGQGTAAVELRRRTLIRAALLFFFVQLLLENFAWGFGDFGGLGVPLNDVVIPGAPTMGPFVYFGVIYAIAASLAVCALFLSASDRLVGTAAFLAVVASPLALLFGPEAAEPINPILGILVYPGRTFIFTAYPLFPWVGVMLIGMLLGRRLSRGASAGGFWIYGVAAFVFGAAVRFLVPFGESTPMSDSGSFFDLSKYPPSLAYLGMTLGLNLMAVSFFDAVFRASGETRGRRGIRPLREFGREPLVFYVGHLYFYAILCWVIVFPGRAGPLLAVWAVSLIPLYLLVRWYRRVRIAGRLPGLLKRL